jgi:two-component system, chemotaxis family, protein-glutamate methylesterase/glutaminase
MQKRNMAIIGSSGASLPILKSIFNTMPRLKGPIILIQHMPVYINQAVCENLDSQTDMTVKMADHDEILRPGILYLAPSEVHLRLEHNERIQLVAGARVNFVCPSIDVAMMSVTEVPHVRTLGILLAGVGDDGIQGISHIKRLGGVTIALDKKATPITGMADEAIATGDVDWVLPPEQIREKLMDHLGRE